jgi:hypothetical protein
VGLAVEWHHTGKLANKTDYFDPGMVAEFWERIDELGIDSETIGQAHPAETWRIPLLPREIRDQGATARGVAFALWAEMEGQCK